MSLPLSTSTDLAMRKELIRLRMEMNRQQILYHSQPLAHPMQSIKSLVSNRGTASERHTSKGPLLLVATAVLAVFGPRLGKVGKLARLGITFYPLVRKLRQ